MIETSLTTSMVFIILIGAAMLTAAFRGFGGEEIVKDFLTSLPGGFWTQFIVVMAVIFVLGFFRFYRNCYCSCANCSSNTIMLKPLLMLLLFG